MRFFVACVDDHAATKATMAVPAEPVASVLPVAGRVVVVAVDNAVEAWPEATPGPPDSAVLRGAAFSSLVEARLC